MSSTCYTLENQNKSAASIYVQGCKYTMCSQSFEYPPLMEFSEFLQDNNGLCFQFFFSYGEIVNSSEKECFNFGSIRISTSLKKITEIHTEQAK